MKKDRQRYILFLIIKEYENKIDQKAILKAFWYSIWRYFGLKEANKIGLWLIELDLENHYGIIRCSHQTKEFIISALTLITEIDSKKIIFSPIKTSGTIKKLKKIKQRRIKVYTNK
ncbi:MAG: Rpp14/Pop5 family protein [Candidatus Hodarchaeota archaeon]